MNWILEQYEAAKEEMAALPKPLRAYIAESEALWREIQSREDVVRGAADGGEAVHRSDCALHNGPAYAPGPCDCGAA